MSRLKKYKLKSERPPSGSFMKIRKQFTEEISEDFPYGWYRCQKKGKSYFFPYTTRHQKLVDMCDGTTREVDLSNSTPVGWCTILSQLMTNGDCDYPSSEDLIVRSVAEGLIGISAAEFLSGRMDNKKFNRLSKKLGFRSRKPDISMILDNLGKLGPSCECSDLKNMLGTSPRGTSRMMAYISSDPWDIFRMGVGRSDMGSCMNILDGGYVDQLMQNMQDPSLAMVYIEDTTAWPNKVNGMVVRALIRLLFYKGQPGIVIDRFYPNESEYRAAATRAVIDTAKKAGVKVWRYKNYLHTQGDHFFLKASSDDEPFEACSLGTLYRKKAPYLDQTDSGGILALNAGHNIIAQQSYEVIDTHE